MIWFTSDMHFYHKNIISYCNRPFRDLEEMHDELIRRFNEKVKPDDTCYLLGDIVFGGVHKWELILSRLNGKKALVQGNHDDRRAKRFLPTMDTAEINSLDGIAVKLSHYPYAPIEPDEDQRYLERRLVDDGSWLLHGHVHCQYKVRRNMINVGVDVWDYYPVSFEEIKGIIKPNQAERQRGE